MAAPPPPLPYDLVQEILLRLPSDDPACLLRTSLVCMAWSSAISRPGFRRRLHELHGAPPLLGFLPVEAKVKASERTPCFIPTAALSFSLAAVPDHRSWLPPRPCPLELLVWEPITRAQQQIPVPAAFVCDYWTAAVLCAADGCHHRDCLGGPFRVVFVFFSSILEDTAGYDEFFMSASVYSSETGAWGELTSLQVELINFINFPSVLVGSSLLYFIFYDYKGSGWILEYDLSRHSLTVLGAPDNDCDCLYNAELAEDSGLGVIQVLGPHLKLWTRDAGNGTDARNLLPTSARLNEGYIVHVLGFVEGANVISVNTLAGLFAIELQSEQASKVCDHRDLLNLVPVVTFYTPVPQGDHQNLLVSKPNEEAGGEEEKTVNQAQQLFENGSNAIKEGDLVNTSESIRHHDHNIRVPHHGEGSPGCASTLKKYRCSYKAQEVNDSLDDVPKSASSEESARVTAREDDARDSNTSGSNVDVAAPSSEKGDSQEGENSIGNKRSTSSTVNNLGVVGRGFKCGNVGSLLNLLQKRLATDCSPSEM